MALNPARLSATDEEPSYLVSVSDLMVGMLFIFIIILMAFAFDFRIAQEDGDAGSGAARTRARRAQRREGAPSGRARSAGGRA